MKKLDMIPILSGAENVLEFSYSFLPESTETAESSAASSDENPGVSLVFDDVTFPEPITVKGSISDRAGYMVLREEAEVSYQTVCARCLAPIEGKLHFTVEKPVAGEKDLAQADEAARDDYLCIRENALDVETPVRDEILMEFPMRFLCREDCAGLCAGCGANLNYESCRCKKKQPDPRFAALTALLDTLPDDEDGQDDAK